MRKILVAGNWKMHGSVAMTRDLLGPVIEAAAAHDTVDVAVFPAFPYLAQAAELAGGSRVAWGAQDLSPHGQGAHTGEVAAGMLTDLGCSLVLVGHSERRAMYGDSDALVAQKFAAAQAAGLVPVLCLGETLEEREAGRTEAVVSRQLDAVISHSGVASLAQAVLAYEPVWAIGTGKTASPAQAQAVHAHLRDKITTMDGTIAGQLRILYGGSVNPSNAAELFAAPDIDGGLIGGASLKAADFTAIIAAAGGDTTN